MPFYYASEGKPLGPVTSEALEELRSRATIDDTTLVVAEGEAHWVPYGERFPASKDSRPVPPILVKSVESAIVSAQRIENGETASASIGPRTKEKISAVAYQRAMAATSRKDEFNTSDALDFPAVKYQFPLDPRTPRLCVECFVAIPGHPEVVLQLLICSRSDHGLVRYNTVKASGGIELKCEHLNSTPSRTENSPTEWHETINIFIPIGMLLKSRSEPLRLQISRPDEGKSFIINVSADSTAAVLYRMFPDRYEVDSADLEEKQKQQALSKDVSIASVITCVAMAVLWMFTPMGFTAAALLGGMVGVAYFFSPVGTARSKAAAAGQL